MRFFNKRKARLIRETSSDRPRRIQVKPKNVRQPRQAFNQPGTSKIISPPPEYNEAIKTISSLQPSTSGEAANIESYRIFNGRNYAVVKTEQGTQLIPVRAPSAAIFNYQYSYTGY